jgi:hypothetical protein
MSIPTIELNGTFTDAAGDPMTGTLSFRLNAPLVDSVGNVVSERVEIVSTLNDAGQITDTDGSTVGLVLYCTSGGDIAPAGLLYDVKVEVGSRPHRVSVALPDSLGATVDWADLVPVPASTGVVWTAPTTGGLVDSVNGQQGVVVLGAADVDADSAGTAAGLVATEATARASADTTLQTNITNEAALARNADNLTSGTVADARIASTIARDSEVTAAIAALSGTYAPLRQLGTTLGEASIVGPDIVIDVDTHWGIHLGQPYYEADPADVTAGEEAIMQVDETGAISFVLVSEIAAKDTATEVETARALAAEALLAPKASPTFTGTPAAPTAAPGTNTTQIATTAFVQAVKDALLNGAGGAYDTLKELQDLIVADETTATALATTVVGKLAKASNLSDLTSASTALDNLGLTANGKSLVTAANYAAMRVLLGLVPGTDVQAYDAELAALAGLTSAADKLPYFTGSGTAALVTLTSFIRTLLDDADAATALETLTAAPRFGEQPSGYYSVPTGTRTTSIRAEGRKEYVRLIIPRTVTVDRIGTETTVAGTSGAVIRLGIHNSASDGRPGTLLLDAGTVDATVTPALLEKTISQQLTPGVYWLASAVQGGAGTRPTQRCVNSTSAPPGIAAATGLAATGGAVSGYFETGITGAFATASISGESGVVPAVTVRFV